MTNEIDFATIAEKLKVKEEVINQLSLIIPFQDVFNFIVSVDTTTQFWTLIDLLPRQEAMHLHSIDAQIPSISKDFPAEFISPSIEKFYIANCLTQGKQPTSINSRAITRIYVPGLRQILDKIECWSVSEDETRVFWKAEPNLFFDIKNLCQICNSFISNGLSWLYFEFEATRIAYCQTYQFLSHIYDRQHIYHVRQIEQMLKNFEFYSSDQIIEELGDMAIPEFQITGFELPPQFLENLRHLLKQVKTAIFQSQSESSSDSESISKGLGPVPPSLPLIDEWTQTRTDALIKQMALPLQQRYAFQLTPPVFAARMGQPNPPGKDTPFEPLSLSELLFSDSNGNVAPMPYSSCKAQLPSQSYMPFCKSSLKKFIARQMLKKGYESVTEPSIDILTDVLINELKTIGQNAARIHTDAKDLTDSDVIYHALEESRYDVISLQNC